MPPGPFVKEEASPSPSPLLHRAQVNVRAVTRTSDVVDGNNRSSPPKSPQTSKMIIRAVRSPERAASPDYIRTPSTVVTPTYPTSPHKQVRGAYVNVQGDEGKMPSDPSTDHDDCTDTGRLEGTRSSAVHLRSATNVNKTRGPLLSGKGTYRPANPKTRSLIPSKKLTESKKTLINNSRDSIPKVSRDENHPPEMCTSRTETEVECNEDLNKSKINQNLDEVIDTPVSRVQRKVLKPNSRLNLEQSFHLNNLKPSGTTPKLCKKLLESNLDTPKFFRKSLKSETCLGKENGTRLVNGSGKIDQNACTSKTETSIDESVNSDSQNSETSDSKLDKLGKKIERKVKRSESYRMANSPIMFIKKFSNQCEKSPKVVRRTPSEELQEELLKERINYPDTVSSPEPQIEKDVDFEVNLITCSIPTIPTSPRPRALDLEPVKALQYSGNDTEIW